MTEQEKREKAIEKLAQFMCETGEKSCAECKGEPDVECAAWNEAVRLYDAGYRKEGEVRREERKTLLNRIRNMYKETGNCINYETLVFIRGLAKEFGVDVEK